MPSTTEHGLDDEVSLRRLSMKRQAASCSLSLLPSPLSSAPCPQTGRDPTTTPVRERATAADDAEEYCVRNQALSRASSSRFPSSRFLLDFSVNSPRSKSQPHSRGYKLRPCVYRYARSEALSNFFSRSSNSFVFRLPRTHSSCSTAAISLSPFSPVHRRRSRTGLPNPARRIPWSGSTLYTQGELALFA